jgi:hypothetical protein
MICKICDVTCFNPTIEVLFCGGATQSVVKKDFAQGWAASATRCDHDIFIISCFPLAVTKFSIDFYLIGSWGSAARFSHVRGLFF